MAVSAERDEASVGASVALDEVPLNNGCKMTWSKGLPAPLPSPALLFNEPLTVGLII